MGAIKSTLNLQGNMAQQLNIIRNSAIGVQTALSRLQGMSLGNISTSANNASATLTRTSVAMQNVGNTGVATGTRLVNAQEKVNNAWRKGNDVLDSMARRMASLFVLYGAIEGVKSLFETADTRRSINGRLQFVVDKGSLDQANGDMDKAIVNMNNRIMDIANRTRSNFVDTAKFVAKVGVNAGKAFKGNNELLAFTEQLNRAFIVAGTSAEEMRSVMLQLPQALGKGILNGDELRSVQESAPIVARTIEDYAHEVLGATGNLKDMAKQGQITSRVIIDAMSWASDTMEERFNKMPKTWAQVFAVAKNQFMQFIQPITTALSNLSNMESLGASIKQVSLALALCANIAVAFVEAGLGVVGVFAETGNIVPLVIAGFIQVSIWAAKATLSIIAQATAYAINNTVTMISTALKWANATATWAITTAETVYLTYLEFATVLKATDNAVEAISQAMAANGIALKVAQTLSTAAYNGVMTMCNVITATGSVVMGIYSGAVAFGATILSVFTIKAIITKLAVIALHLAILAIPLAIIALVVRTLWFGATAATSIGKVAYIFGVLGATIWNVVVNVWNFIISFAEFLGNFASDPLNATKKLFLEFAKAALNILKPLAKAIDGLFKTNTSGFLDNLRVATDDAMKDLSSTYKPKFDLSNIKANEVDPNKMGMAFGKAADEAYGRWQEVQKGLSGSGSDISDYGSLPNDMAATANNTGKIANAVTSSAEDLKYLREQYQRTSLQVYSRLDAEIAPTINVYPQGKNIDGIVYDSVKDISDMIREALISGSEGVHA